jgi:septum formation protein
MVAAASPRLVLASSSPYRRDLLARLRLDFNTHSPNIDESARDGEAPGALALRLASAKAAAVAPRFQDALIIGSDQVAMAGGSQLAKPGNRAAAIAQLQAMSGLSITFHTALCLLNPARRRQQTALVPVNVTMRTLTFGEIERYVDADQPFDCAGSARIEGLGIALVENISGDDPSALIGLPLIELCRMLRNEGVDLP